MLTAIRTTVTVQPGGIVEVKSPELKPDTEAEVIVLVPDSSRINRSLTSFIGAAKGMFQTPDEVEAYIRSERNAWEE